MIRFITTISTIILLALSGLAQPAERLYHISVYPTNGKWNCKPGDKVKFNVLLTRCNVPEGDMELTYDISEDMMKPHASGKVRLHNGVGTIEAGTMKNPGFLRCRVYMKKGKHDYQGMGTVGFSPEKLRPVTQQPSDFLDFWQKALTDARKWDLEPMMTLMPERCTPKVNVYHVSWANNDWGSRMYGILTIPAAPGKYPAIVKVPGAGVRGYNGDINHSEKGFIILELGIHGIPVNLPAHVYHNLYNGPLKRYHSFNMEDKDRFYYKRVITGCVRAIDFIEQLPEYNGCLGTFGGSQGGGLSIILAGIDPRVKGLVSYYPAMSDMLGYTANRAGGWPHTLKDKKFHTKEIMSTIPYFDVSSFAREIKVPGFYTFGYNDMVCPPTSTYSVYNVIDAPKELQITETTEHYAYTEQGTAAWNWIMDFLRGCTASQKETTDK